MVYRITVDGKKKYAEASIREYSIEADNLAREYIIRHFIEDEKATEIFFDNSKKENQELHEKAKEFYNELRSFRILLNNLPKDKPWGVNEMFILIPQLLKIYALSMSLPDPECMEKSESEKANFFQCKDVRLEDSILWYGMITPYGDDDDVGNETFGEDFTAFMSVLEEGIGAYEAGLICKAVFIWRYYLLTDYGSRIRNAMNAMCETWKETSKTKKRIYWDESKDCCKKMEYH
ncbi:hypothetical protein [Oribacterium sp. P6A1]|uniref:hypothetical protein n=1 Tax=Oribacterium sp. P6A1 TaxID=1410612 RepID=UPI0005614AF8|nr:hypothetical protein [Oribacterium sp. P6A1]